MSVAEWLSNSLSPDPTLRQQAEQNLTAAFKTNFPEYVLQLSRELANRANAIQVRAAAGIAIKNCLSSRDHATKQNLASQWLSLDPMVSEQVKAHVVEGLSAPEIGVASQAAQACGIIASVEIPQNRWPTILNELLAASSSEPPSNPTLIQSALMTIGYICEQTAARHLKGRSSDILTAVVKRARSAQSSPAIQVAALQALLNSIEFARENISREHERDYIMSVLCEATHSQSDEVVVAAFQCLGRILQFYYEYMQPYMEKALYELSLHHMRSDRENVVKIAIEFWCTVCEEEIAVKEDMAACVHDIEGKAGEPVFFEFACAQVEPLSLTLLEIMKQQDEFSDEDDWTAPRAAAVCFGTLAECVGNAILHEKTRQFIQMNITDKNDWRARDAAVMALGSLMEGPEPSDLTTLSAQALPTLLALMQDPSLQVKDSTAWAISQICEAVGANLDPSFHPTIVETLLRGLGESPRIITHCCSGIMNLAEALGREQPPLSHVLISHFRPVCTALMQVGTRGDDEQRSRTSAYVALAKVIERSADELLSVVEDITLELLARLEYTIQNYEQIIEHDVNNATHELQSNLCTALTQSVRRLPGGKIIQVADRIMMIALALLKQHGASQLSSVNTDQPSFGAIEINISKEGFNSLQAGDAVVEDIFLVVGALTTKLEADFKRYLSSIAPYLTAALANQSEYNLCTIAVGVVGDLCRALGDIPEMTQLGPTPLTELNQNDASQSGWIPIFMHYMIQALKGPVLKVKPVILSTFGDVALSIGDHFDAYIHVVMAVLDRAGDVDLGEDEYEMYEYMSSLREGIMDAYSGIISNLKARETGVGADKLLHSDRYLTQMLAFVHKVYEDPERSDAIVQGAVGLLGDLAELFLPKFREGSGVNPEAIRGIRELFSQPWIVQMMQGVRSPNSNHTKKTKTYAKWAFEKIVQLAQSPYPNFG